MGLLNFLSNSEFAWAKCYLVWITERACSVGLKKKINGAVGPCCAAEGGNTGLPSLLTAA